MHAAEPWIKPEPANMAAYTCPVNPTVRAIVHSLNEIETNGFRHFVQREILSFPPRFTLWYSYFYSDTLLLVCLTEP